MDQQPDPNQPQPEQQPPAAQGQNMPAGQDVPVEQSGTSNPSGTGPNELANQAPPNPPSPPSDNNQPTDELEAARQAVQEVPQASSPAPNIPDNPQDTPQPPNSSWQPPQTPAADDAVETFPQSHMQPPAEQGGDTPQPLNTAPSAGPAGPDTASPAQATPPAEQAPSLNTPAGADNTSPEPQPGPDPDEQAARAILEQQYQTQEPPTIQTFKRRNGNEPPSTDLPGSEGIQTHGTQPFPEPTDAAGNQETQPVPNASEEQKTPQPQPPASDTPAPQSAPAPAEPSPSSAPPPQPQQATDESTQAPSAPSVNEQPSEAIGPSEAQPIGQPEEQTAPHDTSGANYTAGPLQAPQSEAVNTGAQSQPAPEPPAVEEGGQSAAGIDQPSQPSVEQTPPPPGPDMTPPQSAPAPEPEPSTPAPAQQPGTDQTPEATPSVEEQPAPEANQPQPWQQQDMPPAAATQSAPAVPEVPPQSATQPSPEETSEPAQEPAPENNNPLLNNIDPHPLQSARDNAQEPAPPSTPQPETSGLTEADTATGRQPQETPDTAANTQSAGQPQAATPPQTEPTPQQSPQDATTANDTFQLPSPQPEVQPDPGQTAQVSRLDQPLEATATQEEASQFTPSQPGLAKKAGRTIKNINYKPFAISAMFGILIFTLFNSQVILGQMQYLTTPSGSVNTSTGGAGSESPAIDDERILIPQIDVDAPIVNESTFEEDRVQEALKDGVVHYGNTAAPGEVGNTVLVGHSSNNWWEDGDYKYVFIMLDRLQEDDEIVIHHEGTRYTYEVTDSYIVEPDNMSVLDQPKDTSMLTLITCTPPGTSWQRLIVEAEQISPDPDQNVERDANGQGGDAGELPRDSGDSMLNFF